MGISWNPQELIGFHKYRECKCFALCQTPGSGLTEARRRTGERAAGVHATVTTRRDSRAAATQVSMCPMATFRATCVFHGFLLWLSPDPYRKGNSGNPARSMSVYICFQIKGVESQPLLRASCVTELPCSFHSVSIPVPHFPGKETEAHSGDKSLF